MNTIYYKYYRLRNQVENYMKNEPKYLGVTITSELKWNTHITNTCKSAKQKLGLIYCNFQLADQCALSQLYKALMLPKLDYCSCVLDPSHRQTRVYPETCCKTMYEAMV